MDHSEVYIWTTTSSFRIGLQVSLLGICDSFKLELKSTIRFMFGLDFIQLTIWIRIPILAAEKCGKAAHCRFGGKKDLLSRFSALFSNCLKKTTMTKWVVGDAG